MYAISSLRGMFWVLVMKCVLFQNVPFGHITVLHC